MMDHHQETHLLREQSEHICTISINRPEKHNFLTSGLLRKMAAVITELGRNPDIRVLILRGAGEASFSAGYDISAIPTTNQQNPADPVFKISPLETAIEAIRGFPYPVIAMLNGHAFGGGCELAISCDIRIGRRGITMGMPPAKLGIVYPPAGFRRFLMVLGFAKTLEMFLTGRRYDGEHCLRMGLINELVAPEALTPFVYGLAAEISENAPLAMKGTKQALYRLAEMNPLNDEEEAALASLFDRSLKSRDLKEGRQAFMEKRKPRFKGR
jgi:enoyl-CoA hydratase/carnithine racemase